MVKAVAFDLGNTLVHYQNPLNWQALYQPALEQAMAQCGIAPKAQDLAVAADILAEYNTRLHPREAEVASETIFGRILEAVGAPEHFVGPFQDAFFRFFRQDARPYPDALPTLERLKAQGVQTGLLTDVPYGMESHLALEDACALRPFLDVCLTSRDVGVRKPARAGYKALLRRFGTQPAETLFVGDEPKDVLGANRVEMVSVLISRGGPPGHWGQRHSIAGLGELDALLRQLE